MQRLVYVILLAAMVALLCLGRAHAADRSRVIVLDLPAEKIAEEIGLLPPTKLTDQEKSDISSFRFDADTLKVLAIPVEWTNRPATYPKETIDSLLFSRNVFPGGSVADYYDEISYGQITIVGEVLDWYNAGFYGGYFDFEPLFDYLDAEVDYTQFDGDYDGNVDAAIFVRSGTGEEDSQDSWDIWSYAYIYPLGYGPGPYDGGMHIPRWNTSPEMRPLRVPFCPMPFSGQDTLNRIRVFCHELAHNLGLPDLYDYDNKLSVLTYTTPNDDNDHPLMDWCVMGYYGYGIFSLGTEVPTHMCGWSKKRLGWIEPISLPFGTYENVVLYNIETTKDSSLYMIPIDPIEGEYFLLEYRNPQSTAQYDKMDSDFSVFLCPDLSFGCDTLDRGLLITHIHDSLSPYFDVNDGTPEFPHYTVAVEDIGYNPAMDAGSNPEGHVTDSAQWWYPYETRKGAALNPDVAGQQEFGPSTFPSSDGYYIPTGIYVRVDSIVGDKLYAYVDNPLEIGPQVLQMTPGQNQIDVAAAADIVITFDADIDESSLGESTVFVYGSVSGYKSGDYSYDGLERRLTFDRSSDFAPGEVVTVVLTKEIQTPSGTGMPRAFVSNFTIEAAEATANFGLRSGFIAGEGPAGIATADLDGSGSPDIVVANYFSNDISVFINNGSGNFAGQVNYTVGSQPTAVCASDLDSDGDMDLAVSNGAASPASNVSILLNNGDGTFASHVTYDVDDRPASICAADFDGDGDFDIATANDQSATISILMNDGDGTFASQVIYYTESDPLVICAADLDNDADMDLATAHFSQDIIFVLKNEGQGTFEPAGSFPTGDGPSGIVAAEVDAYGFIDFAVADGLDDSVSILFNYGGTGFWIGSKCDVGSGEGPGGIAAADCDGDGDLDLITPNINTDDISVLLNDNLGVFTFDAVYTAGSQPYWLCTADFDGDGDIDIATADHNSDAISVLYNDVGYVKGDADGSGEVDIDDVVFLIQYIFSGGPAPEPVVAGDADCSSAPDIDDVVYVIAFIFSGGPAPGDPDNNGIPDC